MSIKNMKRRAMRREQSKRYLFLTVVCLSLQTGPLTAILYDFTEKKNVQLQLATGHVRLAIGQDTDWATSTSWFKVRSLEGKDAGKALFRCDLRRRGDLGRLPPEIDRLILEQVQPEVMYCTMNRLHLLDVVIVDNRRLSHAKTTEDWSFPVTLIQRGRGIQSWRWSREGKLVPSVVISRERIPGLRLSWEATRTAFSLRDLLFRLCRIADSAHEDRFIVSPLSYIDLREHRRPTRPRTTEEIKIPIQFLFELGKLVPLPLGTLIRNPSRTMILESLLLAYGRCELYAVPTTRTGRIPIQTFVRVPSQRLVQAPPRQCIACLDFESMYPVMFAHLEDPRTNGIAPVIMALLEKKRRTTGPTRHATKIILNSIYGTLAAHSMLWIAAMPDLLVKVVDASRDLISSVAEGFPEVFYGKTDSLYCMGDPEQVLRVVNEVNTKHHLAGLPILKVECFCEKVFVVNQNMVIKSGCCHPDDWDEGLNTHDEFTGWLFHSVKIPRLMRRTLRTVISRAMEEATDEASLDSLLEFQSHQMWSQLAHLSASAEDLLELTQYGTSQEEYRDFDRLHQGTYRQGELRLVVRLHALDGWDLESYFTVPHDRAIDGQKAALQKRFQEHVGVMLKMLKLRK